MKVINFILPLLLSFIPILLVNWCGKKEDEYPGIKINTIKRKISFYIINFCIIELFTCLFYIVKTNIYELYIIWLVCLILISLSYIDWKTSLIPNRFSYGLTIIGFLTIIYNSIKKDNFVFIEFDIQIISFLIIFICFVLIYFISKNGVGMGDVKIISALSIFLGISNSLFMLFVSSALILIYDVIIKIFFNKKIKELPNNDLPLDSDSDIVTGRVMGLSKINNHTAIVMGPFIAISFVLVYLFGQPILNWWFKV